MTLRIQLFQPINERAITAWLAENPRIDVRGFSVAAGASDPGGELPLSVCAILYEAPPDEGAAPAALAAAEQLIAEVAAADVGMQTKEDTIPAAPDTSDT